MNNIYFDSNITENNIIKWVNNLETLKDVNYQLIIDQPMTNNEIIDTYKNLFIYMFFSTYDKYILMLRKSNQFLASSFVSRYFKFINNKIHYSFERNRYIIINSGYTISNDISNYEIELKINKDTNYLWTLKPIIKDNHLFYFIQYIGSSYDDHFLSIDDINNIKVNIYYKNYIENQNILFRNNEIFI